MRATGQRVQKKKCSEYGQGGPLQPPQTPSPPRQDSKKPWLGLITHGCDHSHRRAIREKLGAKTSLCNHHRKRKPTTIARFRGSPWPRPRLHHRFPFLRQALINKAWTAAARKHPSGATAMMTPWRLTTKQTVWFKRNGQDRPARLVPRLTAPPRHRSSSQNV